MPLESRRLGGGNSQVNEDRRNSSNNDTLSRVLGIGLSLFFTKKLYDTGALQPLVKPIMEVADSIAKEGGERASVTMGAIREWSNLKHLTTAQRQFSNQTFNAAANSIFRGGKAGQGVLGQLADDLSSASSGNKGFVNMKNLIMGTQEDLNTLKQMIRERTQQIPIKRANMLNTDLGYYLNDFSSFIRTVERENGENTARTMRGQYMREFVDFMTLSPKDAKKQLKRNGYRNLTLGDIAEIYTDNGRYKFRVRDGIDFSLNGKDPKSGRSLEDDLNALLANVNNKYRTPDGRVTSIGRGDWKNLMIDKSIRIDDAGNIIDYRMTQDAWLSFQHSLANDFRLPLVSFNPFKTLMHLEQKGRRPIFSGYLAHTQYMPSITGMGAHLDDNGNIINQTIGEYLAREFGEEYAESNVAVINGSAYIKNLKEPNSLFKIADNLELSNITFAEGAYGLKSSVNAERQMAGFDMGHAFKGTWAEYEQILSDAGVPTSEWQKIKYNVASKLDMGFQESRPLEESAEHLGLDDVSSIDEWTNKIINSITDRDFFRMTGYEYGTVQEMIEQTRTGTFKSVLGEGFSSYKTKTGKIAQAPMYYAQRTGTGVSDIVSAVKTKDMDQIAEESKKFIMQYSPTTGRNRETGEISEWFTKKSTRPWMIANALSEGLGQSSKLLGLSTESKSSWGSIATNLLLKRALPVYGLLQIPGMINYFSEPFLGDDEETGQPDNIGRWMMRRVSKIDVVAHKAMDFTGATKVFKFMGEMTPGSEQISELPGIHALGLGQTAEEREEYIKRGVDPVRKGRWWGAGNTPFTGGKIMYFRPNLYRRVQADVEFSDSKWGSRQEYYNNTWYPNPVNPLAPVNHFITNRHYYDYKHYYDRPYLETAPEGSGIPIVGPLFSETIGKVIMRPQKMHEEYWRNGFQDPAEDRARASVFASGEMPIYSGNAGDINTFHGIEERADAARQSDAVSLYTSAYHAKQVTRRTIQDNAGITFQESTIYPVFPSNNSLETYITPSGGMSIVDIPNDLDLNEVNTTLRDYSLSHIPGTNQRVSVIDEFTGPDIATGGNDSLVDNTFTYALGEQYNWLGDIAGLKGFAVQQFITGHPNEHARVIENSGYAYSWNRSFWDENMGGLGGNLSEITRRFIPERNKNTEYVNPIRNTMPEWMPGPNYFQDFRHGDPYSKVPNGEERLPGEGYERLNHIDTSMGMTVNNIGYSREEMAGAVLNRINPESEITQQTQRGTGTIHNQIINNWRDTHFAQKVRGEIQDKRNGIYGTYDAMINNPASPTGLSVMNAEAVSGMQLLGIKMFKKPLEQHKRQVNYLMWATEQTESEGFVYYYDKDNPNNAITVSFNFDRGLLQKTMDDVFGMRKDIAQAMERGELTRADLYSPLDRFRILADVAPYSQEYKDAATAVSMAHLTPEQQKEASEIRDRVTAQKEPLRVYDYKFKTANLKYETVTVDKLLDNNTILTKEYGKQHAVKFAGMRVSESNGEFYKTWDEEYTDKNGRKRTRKTGITMNQAANKELKKYLHKGAKITIGYDADPRNKFSKDSTESIRSVVISHGTNVNQKMIHAGLATEKEDDDSPAAIHARYSRGEMAFGAAMERLTHGISDIPFIGNKVLQVRSPYEQYRKREVYGKDFQSWNTPIRDMLIPSIEENIANNKLFGLGGVLVGGYIGSLFGKSPFGKLVGTFLGAAVPAIGKAAVAGQYNQDRDWRPKRRREQEALNEYVDVLKYVKNTKLYEKYKAKSLKEDHFDVDKFMESEEAEGVWNKLKTRELTDYKKTVKLDFKHRSRYNFKYGEPKYASKDMSYQETISAINKEISEIQSDREVIKLPSNALLAIDYKQQAKKTMYGFEPGDSLVNIMTALPKKERQYFKHFMNAPEEEKDKILRIAPSYLRRALQSSWGMPVDQKPTLDQYFQTHALPDADWIGWDETTDLEDVKVKMINQNGMDPGEFDVWKSDREKADETEIPIPRLDAYNSRATVHMKLNSILGAAGYQDIQISSMQSSHSGTTFNIRQDASREVDTQIQGLNLDYA